MAYRKPDIFYYRFTQGVSGVVANLIFGRRFRRNEIKEKKGPFVVIANHQASLDFVNLIGATRTPMHFVISNAFYSTLPVKGIMDKIGVIPKQQFQTAIKDLRKIKEILDNGGAVTIYPAGLMCEDGLDTPIPQATYKFIKWLGADIYGARCEGTYFVSPKWGKGFRPGRTYMDIYKLFDKDELEKASLEEIQKRADEILKFDAYADQKKNRDRFIGGNNIRGLENVLHMCPVCKEEFGIILKDKNTLKCKNCSFEAKSDSYGFFGSEPKSASNWSKIIYNEYKTKVLNKEQGNFSLEVEIRELHKNKFIPAGFGTAYVGEKGLGLKTEEREINLPIANIPTLPFKPGKCFDIQYNTEILRCYPKDSRSVMKFINLLKIHNSMKNECLQKG